MRLLIITDSIPRADFDSGYRRLAAIMQHAAKQHTITIFARHIRNDVPERERAAKHMRSIGVSQLYEGEWLLPQILRSQHFDAAIFHYYHVAEWAMEAFRRTNPKAIAIVDSGDLHYIREEAAAAVGTTTQAHAALVKKKESQVYRSADLVFTNSDEDDQIFRREFPETPSLMVPNMVPIRKRPALTRAAQLFFVGNFYHQPNVDGILWFAREILPHILRVRPDTILEIGGKNPPPELATLPSHQAIRALGWIPETDPHLDAARIVIAPLRFGGGMKGKVTEALACGAPVVSTTFGAQGFHATNGVHLLVEDEPERFATAIIGALTNEDRTEQMGLAGQELVRSLCSPEVVEKLVDQGLARAATLRPRRPARSLSRLRFTLGSYCQDLGRKLQQAGQRATGLPETP